MAVGGQPGQDLNDKVLKGAFGNSLEAFEYSQEVAHIRLLLPIEIASRFENRDSMPMNVLLNYSEAYRLIGFQGLRGIFQIPQFKLFPFTELVISSHSDGSHTFHHQYVDFTLEQNSVESLKTIDAIREVVERIPDHRIEASESLVMQIQKSLTCLVSLSLSLSGQRARFCHSFCLSRGKSPKLNW